MPKAETRHITLPDDLPQPLTDDYQNRWQAFQGATEAAGISPVTNPKILKSSKYVFAFSEFVAASCTRDPAVLIDLIDSGDLRGRRQPDYYDHKLKACLAEAGDEDSLMRLLRRCRRRELVRIAWRDLAGWANLAETIADLSAFADTCLQHTLEILHRWQCDISGVPTAENGSEQHLVILGLGKLGAGELNFSSDVDLIFAFPQAGHTRGSKQSAGNEDFFSRLGRRLIETLH